MLARVECGRDAIAASSCAALSAHAINTWALPSDGFAGPPPAVKPRRIPVNYAGRHTCSGSISSYSMDRPHATGAIRRSLTGKMPGTQCPSRLRATAS